MLEKWNNNIAKLQTAVLEWILVCVMWHVAPVPPACLTKDWSPVPVSSYRQLWRLRRRMTSVKIVTLSSYIDKAWFEFLLSYPVSFFCFSPICYVGIEYRRTAFGHTYDHGGHCTAVTPPRCNLYHHSAPNMSISKSFFLHKCWTVLSATVIPENAIFMIFMSLKSLKLGCSTGGTSWDI